MHQVCRTIGTLRLRLENMRGGLPQITGNAKLSIHRLESRLQLLKSATGQYQESPATYLPGSHKISSSVTNEIGTGQIEVHFLSYLQQHTGLWLPAVAIIFWTVGAINYPVDTSTTGGNLSHHALVNVIYYARRYHPSTDNGLIGNYNKG
jgi:hypothetical protein